MSRIKDIYKKCSLRVVTPTDNGMVGIGFNLENGDIIRLSVPVSAVVDMHKSVTAKCNGLSENK